MKQPLAPTGEPASTMRRLQALRAMGLPIYVSRRDLPGAAPSRRSLIPCSVAPATAPVPAPASAPQPASLPVPAPSRAEMPVSTPEGSIPTLLRPERGSGHSSELGLGGHREPMQARPAGSAQSAFHCAIAAVLIGERLWLEELGELPLAREQVQLMRAMAHAMDWAVRPVRVQQFDWPVHRNTQLDLGREAACSALAAFVSRQEVAAGCTAVIALGEPVSALLDAVPPDVPVLRTLATRELLQQPLRKREAWHLLRGIGQP